MNKDNRFESDPKWGKVYHDAAWQLSDLMRDISNLQDRVRRFANKLGQLSHRTGVDDARVGSLMAEVDHQFLAALRKAQDEVMPGFGAVLRGLQGVTKSTTDPDPMKAYTRQVVAWVDDDTDLVNALVKEHSDEPEFVRDIVVNALPHRNIFTDCVDWREVALLTRNPF